jgi:hypothetical protein
MKYTGTKLPRREGAALARRIREACKSDRQRLTEDARSRREALRAAIRGEREALRGRCSVRLREARETTDRAIEEARKSAMQLRQLRDAARSPAQRHAAERARHARAYQIRESDDEVRRNLSADLVPAWEARKSRTRGTQHMSRTEAFLEWVHNHPNDAARYYYEAAERAVRETPEETEADYLARQEAERRARRVRQRPIKNLDPQQDLDADAIPF